jgi:hypothetical protein
VSPKIHCITKYSGHVYNENSIYNGVMSMNVANSQFTLAVLLTLVSDIPNLLAYGSNIDNVIARLNLKK